VSDTVTGVREAARAVGRSPEAAAVAVHDLWAGHGPSATPVLAGLDFALAPGERLAVVGQSGCGKSTLLHVLAGLLPALSGEALVDGRAVAAADFEASGRPGCRSGHAAYMFQRDLLLPWKTVLGNAMFAAGVAPGGRGRSRTGPENDGRPSLETRARTVLGEFGLGDALEALPARLSGGMRQRVALARTLVLGRGLVLLDEPLGSLDALTRAEMQGWLLDVMEAHPATWVLVTHDVCEALLLGDRVAVLAGRPARLEGWLQVPLSTSERRRLAGLEAGDLAAFARGIPSEPGAVDSQAVAPGLQATADTMRDLAAQVHGLLRERRTG
jgi:ABC-type nitrate/sulfonate/bicarbonate transport system ATPase subunit